MKLIKRFFFFKCKNNNFIFVDNSNTSNVHLFDNSFHLVEYTYTPEHTHTHNAVINRRSLRNVYRDNMQSSDLQILRKIRLKYPMNPLIGYLNINSLRNKIIDVRNKIIVREMIDRLHFLISETKLDSSFPSAEFHI